MYRANMALDCAPRDLGGGGSVSIGCGDPAKGYRLRHNQRGNCNLTYDEPHTTRRLLAQLSPSQSSSHELYGFELQAESSSYAWQLLTNGTSTNGEYCWAAPSLPWRTRTRPSRSNVALSLESRSAASRPQAMGSMNFWRCWTAVVGSVSDV